MICTPVCIFSVPEKPLHIECVTAKSCMKLCNVKITKNQGIFQVKLKK